MIGTYYDARATSISRCSASTTGSACRLRGARCARREALSVRDYDGEVYLDLQNVTNRENAEELAYSADFSTRSTIRGVRLLPILFLCGQRLQTSFFDNVRKNNQAAADNAVGTTVAI